ncbi:MAG: hypothetical protein AAF624_11425 [Bacteroidota bacterium]
MEDGFQLVRFKPIGTVVVVEDAEAGRMPLAHLSQRGSWFEAYRHGLSLYLSEPCAEVIVAVTMWRRKRWEYLERHVYKGYEAIVVELKSDILRVGNPGKQSEAQRIEVGAGKFEVLVVRNRPMDRVGPFEITMWPHQTRPAPE